MDAQDFGGAGDCPGFTKSKDDPALFRFDRESGFGIERKILRPDGLAGVPNCLEPHLVLQFAHVTRPGVSHQRLNCRFFKNSRLNLTFTGRFGKEVSREKGYVVASRAQRRHEDRCLGNSMEQVAAELSLLGHEIQVSVRGR